MEDVLSLNVTPSGTSVHKAILCTANKRTCFLVLLAAVSSFLVNTSIYFYGDSYRWKAAICCQMIKQLF